jgi:hypothetical protein
MAKKRATTRCSFCRLLITLPLYSIGPDEDVDEFGANATCLDCTDLDVEDARSDGRQYHLSGLQPTELMKED